MGDVASSVLDPWASCRNPESEGGFNNGAAVPSYDGAMAWDDDTELKKALEESRSEYNQSQLDSLKLQQQDEAALREAIAKSSCESGTRSVPKEKSKSSSPLNIKTWLRPQAWRWRRVRRERADKTGTSDQRSTTSGSVQDLEELLGVLGFKREDVGSTNLNEEGSLLGNQCFYLSLAHSWRDGATKNTSGSTALLGLPVGELALRLKRQIEASVLDVRGDAARNDVGDETEAHADFLACALCSQSRAAGSEVLKLAAVVFASQSCSVDVYEGHDYAAQSRAQKALNLVLIWHRPGHFEAVVPRADGQKTKITLDDVLAHLEIANIPTFTVKG